MIEALKSELGVVTTACQAVGIDRSTHYAWMIKDPNYKAWVEDIPDLVLDFAENALLKKMRAGDTRSIIFYLKTKGKSRGFIERQEIEIAETIPSLTQEEREAKIKRLLKK